MPDARACSHVTLGYSVLSTARVIDDTRSRRASHPDRGMRTSRIEKFRSGQPAVEILDAVGAGAAEAERS